MKKTSEFKSTHDLDLDIIDSSILFDVHDEYDKFRIGTCQGLFRVEKFTYDILNIDNTDIGNGHLQDVFDWFEYMCKKDNKNLRMLEVWNTRFKAHLINKRGFVEIKDDVVIKYFRR